LTNAGTLTIPASFTAGNGMENDTSLTLGSSQTLTLNGAGLDNEGALNTTGGTLGLGAGIFHSNQGTIGLGLVLLSFLAPARH